MFQLFRKNTITEIYNESRGREFRFLKCSETKPNYLTDTSEVSGFLVRW